MATRLNRQPIFTTMRTVAGAIAADSGTINDTNYPLTLAVEPPSPTDRVAVYWYAGAGTMGPFDSLDIQLLERDVKYSASGRWVEGAIVQGIRPNEIAFFSPRSTQFCFRVLAANCPAGTGLVVRAASAFE